MKPLFHSSLAVLTGAAGGFSLYSSFTYYTECSSSTPCGLVINNDFFLPGLALAFTAAVECLMFLRRRKTGSLQWETSAQRKTRRIGTLLALVGGAFGAYGLYGLNNSLVSCPANGCSAQVLWQIYGPFEVEFYSGFLSLAVGAALVLASTFMTVRMEKWRKQLAAPNAV
jgi:hypothetical protein